MPTNILYQNKSTSFGKPGLFLYSDHSSVPFDMLVTGIEPFNFSENTYEFAFAGMRMEFCRNSVGLLAGGMYV